jgi:hypothetical protein
VGEAALPRDARRSGYLPVFCRKLIGEVVPGAVIPDVD